MPHRPALRGRRHHDPMLALALIAFGLASLPLAAQTMPDPAAAGPGVSEAGNAAPAPAARRDAPSPARAAAATAAAPPGDCLPPAAGDGTASPATPASDRQGGQDDATAPSNSGSSGWSGGLGGSHIGTTPSGSAPQSPTWQPPTARGLDLQGRPPAEPGC